MQEEFFNIDECEVGEGGEEEDCLDIVFNEAAMEEEAAAIDDLNNRVRVKNELGDFTTVKVCSSGSITCNCNHFNLWRMCPHVCWMEVLHFEKYPGPNISKGNDNWPMIRKRILSILETTHIQDRA